MNTTTVSVAYRPIRLGFCIDESITNFRRAVRLATTLWGGRFNPILKIDGSEKPKHLLRTFRVDAVLPLSDSRIVQDFVSSQTQHLPWPDLHRNKLFINGLAGPLATLLDVRHPLWRIRDSASERGGFPTRTMRLALMEGDQLADAFLATFGDYPDDTPVNYAQLANGATGLDSINLRADAPLPERFLWMSHPLEVTAEGLLTYKARSGWASPGVFVGDPADLDDLVEFWNLRAAAISVQFLPHGQEERLAPTIRSWMEVVRQRIGEDPLARRPGLWSLKERDAGAYGDLLGEDLSLHRISLASWNGLNIIPPRVEFEGQTLLATIDERSDALSVTFALPEKPGYESPECEYQHLILSTRVVVDPSPQKATLRLPFVPQLNRFYSSKVRFWPRVVRAEPHAVGIVVQNSTSHLTLHGVPPLDLATKLFEIAGIKAKNSTAGRIGLRLIAHMGGLEDCRVFKIPGVRQLLKEFGPSKTFSHRQAMQRIGPKFDLFKALHIEAREEPELRPQDVFRYLLKKQVLRAGVELNCANCMLPSWYSLEALAESVDCDLCTEPIQAGPQLQDGEWAYRTSGLFARSADHEGSIPVALALLQISRALDFQGMLWITGLDLSWTYEGREEHAEIDLLVITQNPDGEVELIVGECKTNKELDENQVRSLVTVAEKLKAMDLKTFVVFCKAGRAFEERELDLMNKEQSAQPNFILLTPAELEPYDPFESNEVAGKAQRPRLLSPEGWAHYCKALYLTPGNPAPHTTPGPSPAGAE